MSVTRNTPNEHADQASSSHRVAQDSALSFTARGLLLEVLSWPDRDAEDLPFFRVTTSENADVVRSAISELVHAGYVIRHGGAGEICYALAEDLLVEPETGR